MAGDPADSILVVAASTGADAIVIGHDQWRGWASAGCVCGHVILHAPCPVLIEGQMHGQERASPTVEAAVGVAGSLRRD